MTGRMLPGAVLAAGRSARMGRPKAFLPWAPEPGDTFLTRIVRAMRAGGVQDILVIGRPDDDQLQDAAGGMQPTVRFVENPRHEHGQLTSIVAAVNAVDHPGVRGLLVIPVDMPLVRSETFAAVLAAARDNPAAIVRAVYGGRHGHPVVFDRSAFAPLRRADPSTGAKSVLRAGGSRVLDLEVGDPGVLVDVDSVEDYVAAFGRPPEAFESGMSS